jgi:CRISPR-associated protein Csm4
MASSRLFRLKFRSVHFGDDGLTSTNIGCAADTLFSALCIQALRIGGQGMLDRLVDSARAGSLRFTDLLPFVGEQYFVPKPVLQISPPDAPSDSSAKKAAKGIEYVPVSELAKFCAGTADLGEIASQQDAIGERSLVDRVAIRNGKEDAEPYRVAVFTFGPDAGLWLLVSGLESELDLAELLLGSLSALGGERTSGYGTFTLQPEPVPSELAAVTANPAGAGQLLSLTTALPAENELDNALAGATYKLIRRSGFVASSTYAPNPLRKQDIYKLAAGSVFSRAFDGVVADVSLGGAHPVYSYAMPLFLPIPKVSR